MILDRAAVADTTADPRFVPVTVTAVLADPAVGLAGHPAHLDGVLSRAAFLEHVGEHGHCSLPDPALEAVDFPLPLAAWTAPPPGGVSPQAVNGAGLAWGWACSRALYQAEGHATVNVRKRPAIDAAARYARDARWDIGSGPLKARDVPFDAVLAREVRWHALAVPGALERMLDRVPALGRLTGHGHGAVLAWRVAWHQDRDAWRDRVFPDPAGVPGSIRAPYWHSSRRMRCTP